MLCLVLALALAGPLVAQEKKPAKKPVAKTPAHSKPSPQQIREFNKLEKQEEKQAPQNRGRSPNSGSNAGRAASPR
jgi:hypothetical protein